MRKTTKLETLALAALLAALAPLAAAKDFLLTGVKPDKLVLVDAAARKVARTYTIPEAGPGQSAIVPSPDGKVAYAVVNRWESISGIDLDTGKQVFRADFSTPDRRVKNIFAIDISPDGKELYVFQSPVRLLAGEYRVEDTYIAVYRTADGIGAKPVRTFPAPRRTVLLFFSNDGSKLYALGWDITIFDPSSGKVIGTHKVRHWGRPNYGEPDVLDVWPQWEAARVFSSPYYAVRTDKSPEDPAAYKTGLMTLDLATGEFQMNDFEDTSAIIFSSVINPVRRDEAYMVYTTLTKVDRAQSKVVKRIDLDHTYYDVNIASDGSEIYVGGTMADIAVYRTDNLERVGTIKMPGGADQAIAALRLIRR